MDTRALAMTKSFFAEARRLWQAERLHDSLMTVAAIQVLCIMMNGQCQDKECAAWLTEGRQMAERMKLFGAEHSPETAQHFATLSDKDNIL